MATRRVELRLSVDDLDANKKLDALAAKLDKLKLKFDELSKKVISPKIDLGGFAKADAELDRINEKLDKLGHKRVTSTVSVNVDSHALRRDVGSLLKDIGGGGSGIGRDLAGAAGAGGSGVGSGLLSSLGGANNSYTGALIAALVGWAALLTPSVVPFGLGLGVAGGAAGGALALGSKANQKILQLERQLQTGKGSAKANAPILAQIRAIRQRNAPELGVLGGFKDVGREAEKIFNQALTSTSRGFSGGPGGHPGTSFLTGLMDVLKQIGPFLQQIGPSLGKLLQASAPFLQAFFDILAKSVKTILPAFTKSLKDIQPYIPELSKGFVMIAQGLAGFLKNLGPGMGASAGIFLGSMRMIAAIIRGTGAAVTGFSILFRDVFHGISAVVRNAPKGFEQMAHDIAHIFDGIRHDIAHVWDVIFSDTIGNVERIVNGVSNWDANLRHSIANTYDTIRHDVASAWDTIWNNTVGRVERGVTDVENWFHKLPTGVQAALRGLGAMLEKIGKLALSMLLSGLKSAAGPVLNFVQSIGHDILSIFDKAIGRSSPSKAFFAAGVDIMRGLDNGIQSRYSAIRARVGHMGGSVVSWIREAIRLSGKPMSWLPALTRLVSLESGGNPRAVNPTAVDGQHASGLWQMLPSTFYSYGGRGSLFNPIVEGVAALRYISSRYGSPFNIPGLFSGGYRGYAHGGWITEPVFGMGLHSGIKYAFGENAPAVPEYVGPRGSGGSIINIYQMDDTYSDAKALRAIKLLRTYRTRHGSLALNLG